jgi:hypothetical protein
MDAAPPSSHVVLLVSIGTLLLLGAVSGAPTAGPSGDYTVSADDRSAGANNVTYTHNAVLGTPSNGAGQIENLSSLTFEYRHGSFAGCGADDITAFGIDRNDDDPGTRTDESLLRHTERMTVGANFVVFDLYEGDELAASEDSPVTLNVSDEVVLRHACVDNPDTPGTYRLHWAANGTSDGAYTAYDTPSNRVRIVQSGPQNTPTATTTEPPGGTATETPSRTRTPATRTPTPTEPGPTLPPLPPLPSLPSPAQRYGAIVTSMVAGVGAVLSARSQ